MLRENGAEKSLRIGEEFQNAASLCVRVFQGMLC
jgi:hypothetical protein